MVYRPVTFTVEVTEALLYSLLSVVIAVIAPVDVDADRGGRSTTELRERIRAMLDAVITRVAVARQVGKASTIADHVRILGQPARVYNRRCLLAASASAPSATW